MAPQLAPVPQPIGIFNQFIAPHSETLILREKVMSLSGDSFEIKLQSGQPLLRIQGSILSLSGRKSVFDMAGNHLFDICKELLHLIHTTYAVEDPSKRKLMEIKSSFALFGSKATATFTSANGTAEALEMKGNWFDTAADIIDKKNGAVVARIDRKLLSGRDLLFGQQTYALTVAPGVDMALMVALCIAMDEKNNEEKR